MCPDLLNQSSSKPGHFFDPLSRPKPTPCPPSRKRWNSHPTPALLKEDTNRKEFSAGTGLSWSVWKINVEGTFAVT